MLVHPKNRDGLGINVFNAHGCIEKVKAAGCDLDHLKKATAFEARPEHAEFNEQLIERADGMMAPLTGAEKVSTVACSHFSQGCRACLASCCTSVASLQDDNGNLNCQKLVGEDMMFKKVMTEGFPMLIIPAIIEDLFPGLPHLAQSALNAEHGSFSMATELQVMCAIAQHAITTTDWPQIISQVKSTSPPCADYTSILCDFVKQYAGGANAPIIRYLDNFAKEYGESKKLGGGLHAGRRSSTGPDFLEQISACEFSVDRYKPDQPRVEMQRWLCSPAQEIRCRRLDKKGHAPKSDLC